MFLSDLFISNLTTVLTAIVITLSITWLWLYHNFSYWKRHNIPYIKPHWIFGNLKDIITLSNNPAYHFQKLYNDKRAIGQPILGIYFFGKPCLLLREPELVKSILVKDFNKFSNRHSASDPHSDALGAENLFFVKNPKWKEIRSKVSPFFSSGKIKQMFYHVDAIGCELDNYLCSLPLDPKTKSIEKEIKDISALYGTDVIASIAYGINANSIKNPNGEFRTNGKRIFHFTRRRAFEFQSMFFFPKLVRLFGFQFFSKETSEFLRSTIMYTMSERIKSGVKRNDLIDILVDFKQSAERDSKQYQFTDDALVAQAAVFFSAGFETSASTMSFALYELAKRSDIQKRLRNEIREYLRKNNGKVTYEMVNEMPYMHMILQEVLRMYPPLPFLDRECTLNKDEKGYSLQPYSDFVVPNNMPVFISSYAMQRDPQYYENPDIFDPERFSPANKAMLNSIAYLPFGTGPHNCIGERFGIVQTKVGLIYFLRNHYVTPCKKTLPIMLFEPRALLIQSEGGIYLNIVKDPLL